MATRHIKPLEIILTDRPTLTSPNLGSDSGVCCMCLKVRRNSVITAWSVASNTADYDDINIAEVRSDDTVFRLQLHLL